MDAPYRSRAEGPSAPATSLEPADMDDRRLREGDLADVIGQCCARDAAIEREAREEGTPVQPKRPTRRRAARKEEL